MLHPTMYDLNEGVTARYQAVLKDELGVPIPAASLTTLTLTLYRKSTGVILNSRDNQNVLNANGVTVDGAGHLEWTLTPADNAVITTAAASEIHVALFEWTYNGGNSAGNHEIWLNVKDLGKVP